MNVRDPFGLHHKQKSALSILRTTAVNTAAQFAEKAVDAGIQAIDKGKQAVQEIQHDITQRLPDDMGFTIPKNVPSFDNPQRHLEDRVWGNPNASYRGSAHGAGSGNGILGGVQDRMGDMFDRRGGLPMYKDKPYGYGPGRSKPIWKKKRCLGFVLVILGMLYFSGILGGGGIHDLPNAQRPLWGWLNQNTGDSKHANWDRRRELVVEAFELSWDSYKRYAWGTFFW